VDINHYLHFKEARTRNQKFLNKIFKFYLNYQRIRAGGFRVLKKFVESFFAKEMLPKGLNYLELDKLYEKQKGGVE